MHLLRKRDRCPDTRPPWSGPSLGLWCSWVRRNGRPPCCPGHSCSPALTASRGDRAESAISLGTHNTCHSWPLFYEKKPKLIQFRELSIFTPYKCYFKYVTPVNHTCDALSTKKWIQILGGTSQAPVTTEPVCRWAWLMAPAIFSQHWSAVMEPNDDPGWKLKRLRPSRLHRLSSSTSRSWLFWNTSERKHKWKNSSCRQQERTSTNLGHAEETMGDVYQCFSKPSLGDPQFIR